jgi:hypothetical protein
VSVTTSGLVTRPPNSVPMKASISCRWSRWVPALARQRRTYSPRWLRRRVPEPLLTLTLMSMRIGCQATTLSLGGDR